MPPRHSIVLWVDFQLLMKSETLLQNICDVLRSAHCVEMNCRNPVCDEILALHDAPFGSYAVYSLLVIPGFSYLGSELERNVKRKRFRKHVDLSCSRKRLETRDYRNGYASFTASVDKVVVDFVVEEHLRNDIVGSGIYLLLQILDVGLYVCCFKMLFRISSYADTEISAVFGSLVLAFQSSLITGASLIFPYALPVRWHICILPE